jgi:hypothetical protein
MDVEELNNWRCDLLKAIEMRRVVPKVVSRLPFRLATVLFFICLTVWHPACNVLINLGQNPGRGIN